MPLQAALQNFRFAPSSHFVTATYEAVAGHGFANHFSTLLPFQKILNQDAFSAALIREPPAPMPSAPLLSTFAMQQRVQNSHLCPRQALS